MYIETMADNASKFIRMLELMMKKYGANNTDMFSQMRTKAARQDHLSLYSENNTANRLVYRIGDLFIHKDGKTYAKICIANKKAFFVNDFNLFNKVGRRSMTTQKLSDEETKQLDRLYTKYMLWANFDRREEFCADFIHNKISNSRELLKDLAVDDRKRMILKIKKQANETLDELTKEIVDEYMFAKFFGHLYARDAKNRSYTPQLRGFGLKWNMYSSQDDVYRKTLHGTKYYKTLGERAFYAGHTNYFVNLVMCNFAEYNAATYTLSKTYKDCFMKNKTKIKAMTPDCAEKIVLSHEFNNTIMGCNSGVDRLIEEIVFDKIVPGMVMDDLFPLPFECYENAFNSVYGGGKQKELQQAK